MTPPLQRLLVFSRRLQGAETFEQLLIEVKTELKDALGYAHAWLMVAETEEVKQLRMLDLAGTKREIGWEIAPLLQVAGDPLIEEIVRSDVPVVVVDARTDPRTNKEIITKLDSRTIINVPLRLLDKPFGAFGTGTFGDEEGCRVPTRQELDFLVGMAAQVAVCAGRIRYVAERKQSQAKMQKLEAHLRNAQKMEAIGRLAGGVAHDFNNLLSVIIGFGNLVLADLEPASPLRPEMQQILGAAERAARLTSQLLAFGRRQFMEPRPLNINSVLRDLEPMFSRVIREDIRLLLKLDPGLWNSKLDEGQLEQVVMNLVINARDASPAGGSITLETRNEELDAEYASEHVGVTPGAYVLLAVSDTGVGMDEAVQAQIFEPFFTTKPPGMGTGLGLATVFGIVAQSGGHVAVISAPGRGATFKLYLPRCETPVEQAVVAPLPRAVHGVETVLVADDNDRVRNVAVKILRRYGYTVLEAMNAAHALSLCESYPEVIHLLVTDVVMPHMSGGELAVRLASTRPQLRVLFMSGYAEKAIVQHGVLSSGLYYLQKPFSPETLARRVRQILDMP